MQLVNLTPVPAKLHVTTAPAGDGRIGMLIAKATFCVAGGSSPRLDASVAEPIHDDDVEAPDGLLPCDVVPRRDQAMEVIVLGRAQAPGGRPTAKLTASLRVDRFARELVILGDRHWTSRWGRPAVSEAEVFSTMPMCWTRAFGGTAEVWIDRGAAIEIADPINRHGLGFDPGPLAEGLCRELRAPTGFPVLPPLRRLPNLEDPMDLIRHPAQRPVPACWATVPRDVGIGLVDAMFAAERGLPVDPQRVTRGWLYRCHPAWVLPPLPRNAALWWSGLETVAGSGTRLPALRVLADVLVGERESTLELCPQTLVLRPSLGRMHLTYRGCFRVSAPRPGPRIMRLRLCEGWMNG